MFWDYGCPPPRFSKGLHNSNSACPFLKTFLPKPYLVIQQPLTSFFLIDFTKAHKVFVTSQTIELLRKLSFLPSFLLSYLS